MDPVGDLEALTQKQLQALLNEQGLPVTGNKAELVKGLNNSPTGPKPKQRQHSNAKEDVHKAFLDSKSPLCGISIAAIMNSDARFK